MEWNDNGRGNHYYVHHLLEANQVVSSCNLGARGLRLSSLDSFHSCLSQLPLSIISDPTNFWENTHSFPAWTSRLSSTAWMGNSSVYVPCMSCLLSGGMVKNSLYNPASLGPALWFWADYFLYLSSPHPRYTDDNTKFLPPQSGCEDWIVILVTKLYLILFATP